MKTYSLLRRGNQHKDFCEDYLLTIDTPTHWIGVVSDGCSSGEASHFASTLSCKLIRQLLAQYPQILLATPNVHSLGKKILLNFMEMLAQTQTFLSIPEEELLATLLLAVHSYQHEDTFIGVLGDGIVACDEEIIEYDHHNEPRYPAQYLGLPEVWERYVEEQIIVRKSLKNLAISTDGISQFRSYKTVLTEGGRKATLVDPLTYLLQDSFLAQTTNMLSRKTNILDTQYGLLPMDDLGIVRVIF